MTMLGRRSVLIGGAGGAAALYLGFPGIAAASPAALAAPVPFNLDTGNFIRDLSGAVDSRSLPDVAPMDVTLHMRITHMVSLAWFDACAPYHATAVGVYSRFARRPASESTTNRTRNIAAVYGTFQIIKGVAPDRIPAFRTLITAIGLNPDDLSEDPTTPVGIGNLAGKAIVAARLHDGMNQIGDVGRRYNFVPYRDYTGYKPVNTAFKLTNPSRWQPQLTPHRRRLSANVGAGDKGIFTVQHFVTPQLRLVRPYSFKDPGQFPIARPDHSDHHRRWDYKRSVDEVLAVSAGLTDEQKVKAEFFDDKLLGIGHAGIAAGVAHPELDLDGWIHLFLTTSIAIFDALIANWHQKVKYDAVRPFSAIRHVYGSRPVTAWGGIGKGTVHNLPADEWAGFLNVGDHPEYPSGSTTLCSAEAQAARRFLGDDTMNWTYPVPAGWSQAEPGITPAGALELHWPTWTDFVKDCATSRVWGGVHFRTTIERSIDFGEQFGDLAYGFVQRYVKGDV
jgi:hypothetical protein